ncbi:MAG: ABC transporter permease [Spirochaetes bacterium]|nr:ABC transporter permease [Spirochaetota bacterium]
MLIKQFFAMVKARTMEFVRDRGTFFWNLLFPLFLVFGISFAFSGGEQKMFKIAVVGGVDPLARVAQTGVPLASMEQMQLIAYDEAALALAKLERHQVDMVLDLDRSEFAVNGESSKGQLLRELFVAQLAAGAAGGSGVRAGTGSAALGASTAAAADFSERLVSGRGVRYVDWLVPGVIGMNMMFSSLFGVGFVLVRYRKNGVLKRFKATPVSALNFVSAQAASRLLIVFLTSIFVFVGADVFLNFMMLGNYLTLLLVALLAILCMIALGLVFAARIRSEELASGLVNLVTMPMLALSGVFISLEGSPAILRTASRFLPLTHFTEAARKIMLDGATLAQIAPHVLVLGGFTIVFLALAALMFKWE